MRNEAHRFSLKHHRKKRSKGALSSELDGIKGVGEASRNKLLDVFGSVKGVREASLDDLKKVVNSKTAQSITDYFA